jgi:RHS repeat-associated protein
MSGELVAEYLAETQPAAPYGEYGYRNGLLLVTSNCADGLRWVMTDHLASARVEVSLQGGVAKRHDYLPFGEELYAGSGNHDLRGQVGGYPGADCIRQKFTGKERDTETGLDFFGARHYASVQGRFTGVDPVKLTSARLPRPQGLNLYTYALNNPLKMVDPDGKDVYLANDDEEDRRKSLDLILVNTTDAEKKNIRYRRNANGKFELYVKDPSKIDLSKASAGYKKLVDRINNHDLKIGVSYVRQGGSASLEPMGMQGTISHREVMNGHGGGVTITMDESNIGVYIAEGAGKSGVIGLTASGKETPIAQFEHIVMAHELFGETLKYTPEGRRAGLNQDAHRIDDSNKVIDIENEVRTFHGLPKRSYNGHINLDSMEIKAK